MSRVVKAKEKHHVIAVTGDRNRGRAVLVGSGSLSYLWIDGTVGGASSVYTFSGPVALRALAKAILKEIPQPKPRKRAKQ